jgi:hypothetical protein
MVTLSPFHARRHAAASRWSCRCRHLRAGERHALVSLPGSPPARARRSSRKVTSCDFSHAPARTGATGDRKSKVIVTLDPAPRPHGNDAKRKVAGRNLSPAPRPHGNDLNRWKFFHLLRPGSPPARERRRVDKMPALQKRPRLPARTGTTLGNHGHYAGHARVRRRVSSSPPRSRPAGSTLAASPSA